MGSNAKTGTVAITELFTMDFFEIVDIERSHLLSCTFSWFNSIETNLTKVPKHNHGATHNYIESKWVYIFYLSDKGKPILEREIFCKYNHVSKTEELFPVSWNTEVDRTKWQSTFPRPHSTVANTKIVYKRSRKYYVFLASSQLTYLRISQYVKNVNSLAARSLYLDPLKIKSNHYSLKLCCPLHLVELFAAVRNDAEYQYVEWISDPAKNERRYLAGLTYEIAKNKKSMQSWLDFQELRNEVTKDTKTYENLSCSSKSLTKLLTSWKRSHLYQEALYDCSGSQESENAVIKHVAAVSNINDFDFLSEEAGDEDSWINRFFNTEMLLFYRKLATLAADPDFQKVFSMHIVGTCLKFNPDFNPANKYTPQQYTQMQAILEKKLASITKHFTQIPTGKNGKKFKINQLSMQASIDGEIVAHGKRLARFDSGNKNWVAARNKWDKEVAALQPLCKAFWIAFEIVNVSLAIKDSLENNKYRSYWDEINAAGAIADFIMPFKPEKLTKKYKAIATKGFATVSFAGSICTYVCEIPYIADASSRGLYGTMTGHTLIAASAIASLASAGATITGELVFGIAAGPLGVASLLLFVGASVVLLYFSEEELRNWCTSSSWGKKYSTKPIKLQIHEFHEILCTFQAEVSLCSRITSQSWNRYGEAVDTYEWFFTLEITPGYYSEKKSIFQMHLIIQDVSQNTVLYNNSVVVQHGDAIIEGNRLVTVIHLPTSAVIKPYNDFAVELTGYLDYDGTQNDHLYFKKCKKNIAKKMSNIIPNGVSPFK